MVARYHRIYSQDWIRTKTTILHLAYTVIRSYDIVSYRQHFVIMAHHQRSFQKDTDAAAHDRQGNKWPQILLRSFWHFRLWGLWPYPVHQISREHTNVTRCCHGGSPPGHKCVSLRLLVSWRVYEPDWKKIMIMAQLRTPGKYRRVHSDPFAHKQIPSDSCMKQNQLFCNNSGNPMQHAPRCQGW